MSRLSGFPTGLLSLLGSQNFGEAPNELGDVIAPTVDIGELFALTRQEAIFVSYATPTTGNNNGAGLIVPPGEIWRVMAGGAFAAPGAGVTFQFGPHVIVGNTTPLAPFVAAVASQIRVNPIPFGGFWIGAGSELGVYLSDVVGVPGAGSVSLRYLVQKFRA